ncbi:glycosyltransferase family 39 protein [Patescibacteria group bacterium]|nr:glycosyltransferase family 39 protein [Patescibacteria group bacterium]
MRQKITKYFVAGILGLMFILLFSSAWNDSAVMDELAHIPAGYSYLAQQDFRLNPEHPPLIKDLAALPLLFLNLNFPTNIPAWTTEINSQWDMGTAFLYESGNDANKIIRWARLPIILLTILFGWMFFRWVSGLYGDKVGLLALLFFAASPTFLAHSKYVTTDLGASFGFFIGIAALVNFLHKNTTKSLILCGVALGIAELLKFSLVLLAPIYIILGGFWVFLNNYGHNFNWRKFIKEEFTMLWKIFLIGLIGFAIIWVVYIFHVWNYPIEKQVSDTGHILSGFKVRFLANFVIWLAGIPQLRAIGEYLFGVLMVLQRAAGGNNVYFLSMVANKGWPYYFPLLYLLKEHLAFHILTLIAIVFGIQNIRKSKEKNMKSFLSWLKENFAITAGLLLIIIYWAQAITSPLNIGIRHVMPTFPFIYLMVSRQIVRWVKEPSDDEPQTFFDWLKKIYTLYFRPLKRGVLVILLLAWMFLSTIINFPNYLSYYNELAGGTANGYKIAVDSNYDWGQDLNRLGDFIAKNNINKIAIDYFGAGNPRYSFGNKFVLWHSKYGSPLEKENINWVAISATFLQESRATPVKGFNRKFEDTLWWLAGKEPVARAGTSIFIYKL